jgi:hypothetical protein
MLRKALYALALLALLILLLLLLPEGTAGAAAQAGPAGEAQPVRVVNLPRVLDVRGEVNVSGPVEVAGPVQHARSGTLDEVVVTPTGGRHPTQLLEAGSIAAEGFGFLTISLVGEVRGRGATGQFGVVLVPHVEGARTAFREGRLLLPLELQATVDPAEPWVAATSVRHPVAFPRYLVYLYNTSERTVAARVYAHLSS